MIFILVGAECCFASRRRNFFSFHLLFSLSLSLARFVEISENRSIYFMFPPNLKIVSNYAVHVIVIWLKMSIGLWRNSIVSPALSFSRLKLRLNYKPEIIDNFQSFDPRDVINYNRCHFLHLRRGDLLCSMRRWGENQFWDNKQPHLGASGNHRTRCQLQHQPIHRLKL
jgi:hypothetical protein